MCSIHSLNYTRLRSLFPKVHMKRFIVRSAQKRKISSITSLALPALLFSSALCHSLNVFVERLISRQSWSRILIDPDLSARCFSQRSDQSVDPSPPKKRDTSSRAPHPPPRLLNLASHLRRLARSERVVGGGLPPAGTNTGRETQSHLHVKPGHSNVSRRRWNRIQPYVILPLCTRYRGRRYGRITILPCLLPRDETQKIKDVRLKSTFLYSTRHRTLSSQLHRN